MNALRGTNSPKWGTRFARPTRGVMAGVAGTGDSTEILFPEILEIPVGLAPFHEIPPASSRVANVRRRRDVWILKTFGRSTDSDKLAVCDGRARR